MKLEENPHALDSNIPIERVQIGVRMEKRMLKVLKALAEYFDISLGDLLEGMTLHAFDNKTPFSKETLQRIEQLKEVYGMDYDVSVSHQFTEHMPGTEGRKTSSKEENR
jgi:hypothetical protein